MIPLTTKQVQVIASAGARLEKNVPEPEPDTRLCGRSVSALATDMFPRLSPLSSFRSTS